MAKTKKCEAASATPVPDFSFKMTDRELMFSVETYGEKLVVDGTHVSQIKSLADLERYVDLVNEVAERVDLQQCCDTCKEEEEDCCGPCYCGQ